MIRNSFINDDTNIRIMTENHYCQNCQSTTSGVWSLALSLISEQPIEIKYSFVERWRLYSQESPCYKISRGDICNSEGTQHSHQLSVVISTVIENMLK